MKLYYSNRKIDNNTIDKLKALGMEEWRYETDGVLFSYDLDTLYNYNKVIYITDIDTDTMIKFITEYKDSKVLYIYYKNLDEKTKEKQFDCNIRFITLNMDSKETLLNDINKLLNRDMVIIPSIIKTPDIPLAYSRTRSLYTHEERYEQTKKTIESVKDKLPFSRILLVDCSQLEEYKEQYIRNNVDIFINLYDNIDDRNRIYSRSKSLGESTMMTRALQHIQNNKIQFELLYKAGGRYFWNNNFKLDVYPEQNIFNIAKNPYFFCVNTGVYKLSYDNANKLLDYLLDKNIYEQFLNNFDYELIIGNFSKGIKDIKYVDKIGMTCFQTLDKYITKI